MRFLSWPRPKFELLSGIEVGCAVASLFGPASWMARAKGKVAMRC